MDQPKTRPKNPLLENENITHTLYDLTPAEFQESLKEYKAAGGVE